MKRKTLSPVFVAAVLLAVTACILSLTFYLQALNVKSMYGTDIRKAIYETNEITATLEDTMNQGDYKTLVHTAARIEALSDAGMLHPEIDKARLALAKALYEYADALADGSYSQGAMKLLFDDTVNANSELRLLVQHAISSLADVDVKKMDRAFYKAMNQSSRFYKETTLLARHEG